MDKVFVKQIIESLIFVNEKPITLDEIQKVLDDYNNETLLELIGEIKSDYLSQKHGINLIEIAGGYQFVTDSVAAPHLNKFYKNKHAQRLTKASLETLAIIAYRQPVTRAEIEAIRGVNVDGSIKTLLERNLLRIVGRKDVLGRPILYGTTKKFLEHFGLNSLQELPQLPEFTEKDLEFIRDDSLKIPVNNEAPESAGGESVSPEQKEEISEEKKEENSDEYKETAPENR